MTEENSPLQRVEVELCPICQVPPCYCHFFKLHPEETEPPPPPSVEGEEDGEAPPSAEVAQEAAPPPPPAKTGPAKPKINIQVKSRTKRKMTTTAMYLENWGINVKDFSKAVSKKMAIGCSTKNKQDGVVLVVQGDASSHIVPLLKNAGVPQNMIQITRKTKQTPKEPPQPPPQ